MVDFIAEDKCVPAHLVSPSFSSSSFFFKFDVPHQRYIQANSGSQFSQKDCLGYFQKYSWCVFLVVGVVVVDFIAEDKCVPAHLVSPNFSSSSLDSQQP